MSAQSIPNFADVSLSAGADSVDADRWRIDVAQETGQPVEELTWSTPEGIDVRPLYSATDREGLGFVDLSFCTWPVPHDVCESAMDHSPICRIFYC